ncbi:MAG: DUF4446 family protein [Candidatus Niyogibacteria bacterium]|nr:DUF4446 family protein [Candidatus Niyogibacteria bacterium]
MILGADISFIFSIAALVLGAVSLLWLGWLEWRFYRLFRGRAGESLEHLMRAIASELERSIRKHQAVDTVLENIELRLRQSAQNFGLVRFNPYADAGGDQSFALAVLNEHKSGFILSSLFHRDGTRIFAKPILNGTSTYPLSSEEQGAIEQALARQHSAE